MGGAKNDNFHEIQIIQSLRSNNVLVGIIGVGPQCENLREFTLAQSLCLIYKKISQLGRFTACFGFKIDFT